jgi:hypothetical protein
LLSGGADDTGDVNGNLIGPGLMPSEILIFSPQIVFNVLDTYGGNIGVVACICIPGTERLPLGERNPLIPRALPRNGGTSDQDGWKVTTPPLEFVGGVLRNQISVCNLSNFLP